MPKKKEIPTLCRMCDHGCGILVTVEDGIPIHVRGNPAHPFSKGWLCLKGKSCLDLFHSPNRLKTPMIRRNGRLRDATWDDALAYAADRLHRLKDKWGANPLVSHEPVPPKIVRRLKTSDTRLVVIDPRKTETAQRADIHLPIRPGTLHVAQGWESSNANRLTSVKNSDPISGFPNLKSLECRLRRVSSKTPSSSL